MCIDRTNELILPIERNNDRPARLLWDQGESHSPSRKKRVIPSSYFPASRPASSVSISQRFLWACDQQPFSTGLPAENLPSWISTALGHRGPGKREGSVPRYPAQEDSRGAEGRPPKPLCFASVIYVRRPRPFSSRFMAICPGRDINHGIYGNLNLSKIQKTPRLAAPSPGVLRAIRVEWLSC